MLYFFKNFLMKDIMMRILVIEDEISLNKTIIDNLNEFGYQTDSSEKFQRR